MENRNKKVSPVLLFIAVLIFSAATVSASGVADAKLSPDGMNVTIENAVVTASFDDCYYIQSPSAHCGLKVVSALTFPEHGDQITLTGTMQTSIDGERELLTESLQVTGSGQISPTVMKNKNIGGGNWHYSLQNGAGQRGRNGAAGLNNIGLLVRTSGKVTFSDPMTSYFFVDDGSDLSHPSENAGLKVDANGLWPPPEGAFVVLTGISSLESVDGSFQSVLRLLPDGLELAGSTVSGTITQITIQTHFVDVGSPHPCPNFLNEQWVINAPKGTPRMRVHFPLIELDVFDDLFLKDHNGVIQQEISYNFHSFPLNNFWSRWIATDKLTLHLITNELFILPGYRYGFRVDKYETEQESPLAGVTVTLTPGNHTTVTDSEGRYSFTGLESGLYTVTPIKQGVLFAPPFMDIFVPENGFQTGIDFQVF